MLVYTSINDEFIRLIIEGYVIPTPGKFRSKIGPLEARTNVLDFGELFQGTIENESISIFNSSEDTISITQINELEFINMKIEPQILKPEQSAEITIQYSATMSKLGKSITVCEFEIIKKGTKNKGQLSIMANVIEDFSLLTEWEIANPPVLNTSFKKIDLGKLRLNELTTKEIEITNRGKRDLVIHDLKASNSMYKIVPKTLKIKPGEKKAFQLSIEPTPMRNNIVSKLTIISNDSERSVINFTITGDVEKPEEITLENVIIEIQTEEANDIIQSSIGQDEIVILDVRTPEEYNNGYIENAININFNSSQFQKKLKLMNKQKTYFVYCRTGVRSRIAVDFMKEIGFNKIYHMHEGIAGWRSLGLKLIEPN